MNPGQRARLALAVAAREAADYAHGYVGDVSVPMPAGERIRSVRRLRLMALAVLDRAVLVELADGASWQEVADSLGLPLDETLRRYQETADLWAGADGPQAAGVGDFEVGLAGDLDPAGTAAALDAWYVRHAEPWDARVDRPVSSAL